MDIRQFTVYIGTCCKRYRQKIGYTQQEMAFELGTTRENIAKFESGNNRNYTILLWYVMHGLAIDVVVGMYVNESKRYSTVK